MIETVRTVAVSILVSFHEISRAGRNICSDHLCTVHLQGFALPASPMRVVTSGCCTGDIQFVLVGPQAGLYMPSQHSWCAQNAGGHLNSVPPPAPAASPELYFWVKSGAPKERDLYNLTGKNRDAVNLNCGVLLCNMFPQHKGQSAHMFQSVDMGSGSKSQSHTSPRKTKDE